jgi:glutamate formiminotransferase/formiminotetrahydrofolate cyclodeaminase
MGAALAAIVANLTVRSRDCAGSWDEMSRIAPRAQELKDDLLRAIDEDTAAFNVLMDAMRRGEGVQEAILGAADAPMSVLRRCPEIAALARVVAERGLQASLSDAGVAASCARSASEGAYFNVMINISQLEDRERARAMAGEAASILEETARLASGVIDSVRTTLLSPQSGEGQGK